MGQTPPRQATRKRDANRSRDQRPPRNLKVHIKSGGGKGGDGQAAHVCRAPGMVEPIRDAANEFQRSRTRANKYLSGLRTSAEKLGAAEEAPLRTR
jgi:hypothetical protein